MAATEEAWVKQLGDDIVWQSTSGETSEAMPTIFRVPSWIKCIAPHQFEPRTLQVGLYDRTPYATGSQEFKVAVAGALMQHKGLRGAQGWNYLVGRVVSNPGFARQQYERVTGDQSGSPDYVDIATLSDDAVANMLTMDAVFVVAFLQVATRACTISRWEEILTRPRLLGLSNPMQTELGMLQNQVPMSCLEGAVRVILQHPIQAPPVEDTVVQQKLEELLRHAVGLLYPLANDPEKLVEHLKREYNDENSLGKCSHILDCLYRVVSETRPGDPEGGGGGGGEDDNPSDPKDGSAPALPPQVDNATDPERGEESAPVLSAKELKVTGIDVRSSKKPTSRRSRFLSKARHLLGSIVGHRGERLGFCRLSDVTFVNRRWLDSWLLLPQLDLYDTTAGELRNLAVYEFLAYPLNGHVRKYMRFMNDLITDAGDAALVLRSGVIVKHIGGSDQIVSFWSGLNQGITTPFRDPKSNVEKVEKAVRGHCRKFRRRCFADIRSTLFGKPTLFFSAVCALILLILTFLQAYASLR